VRGREHWGAANALGWGLDTRPLLFGCSSSSSSSSDTCRCPSPVIPHRTLPRLIPSLTGPLSSSPPPSTPNPSRLPQGGLD
jgi:hypothetical protein